MVRIGLHELCGVGGECSGARCHQGCVGPFVSAEDVCMCSLCTVMYSGAELCCAKQNHHNGFHDVFIFHVSFLCINEATWRIVVVTVTVVHIISVHVRHER